MTILFEERPSGSPYVETVTRGRTVAGGATIRPSEIHWHMVLRRLNGRTDLLVVGPWTESGVLSYDAGAELLWIKFRLGVFMPHLPVRELRDREMVLPNAAGRAFWLEGSAWQFPDYHNVETFVDRLARAGVLERDPVVDAALRGRLRKVPPRTVRHHFLQTTGLSQKHIHQFERAQQAAARLQQGAPILDTVFELGYYDQPHLTRSLKRFIGRTPSELAVAAPA